MTFPRLTKTMVTKSPLIHNEVSDNNNHHLAFVLEIIIVILIGALGLIGYHYNQLIKRLEQITNTSNPLETLPSPSIIPSIKNAIYSDWKIYTNDKFGFSLKYPPELILSPKEVDIKADSRDYHRKCITGIFEGCGGSRWPDFKISFLRPNDKAAFDVRIYQLPVNLGIPIIKDNFTYDVSTFRQFDEDVEIEPIDDYTLASIRETFQFYRPEKPLACLWEFTELGPGFGPIKDKSFIDENKDKLTQVSGYSFSSSTKSCTKLAYYTWTGQIESDKPPFITLNNCMSTCTSK